MKRLTHEEFCKKIFDLVQTEYEVKSNYVSTHQKIKMCHVSCGTSFDVKPSNFLQGTRCYNVFLK